jgi:hypothetical protein
VLLVSCEDDPHDTIRPRLDAAGADVRLIDHLTGIRGTDGKVCPFNLLYVHLVAERVRRDRTIKLVLIDPVSAYVGGTGVDDHNDSDLRALLGPLATLAADTGVAIVFVKHFNKGATTLAMNKVSGSAAYINAVRAAHAVLEHPDDSARRLFLPLKQNLSERPRGLEFRVRVLPADRAAAVVARYDHLDDGQKHALARQLVHVEWLGETDLTANDAISPPSSSQKGEPVVRECMNWLRFKIGSFAWPNDELTEAAERKGFKRDRVKKAKERLKRNDPPLQGKPLEAGREWWYWFGLASQPAPKRLDHFRSRPVEVPPEPDTPAREGS